MATSISNGPHSLPIHAQTTRGSFENRRDDENRDETFYSAGSGKLLHYFIDAKSWDKYFPKAESENPFPETFYPKKRPVSLELGGSWQYVETDWAALDVTDEEFGGDWSVSKWIGEQLSKKHDKPFFLGCGLYRPHEPWFVIGDRTAQAVIPAT